MHTVRNAGLVFAAVLFVSGLAGAGQPMNINSLPAGTRFCPAPGADNTEFMSSYFSVDAQTGQMTRHDANSGSVGIMPEPAAKEEVLFVSPPISVENVYVPPPGGSPVPPQTRATGVMPAAPAPRYARQTRQQVQAQPRPARQGYSPAYPQQQQASPAYAQTYPQQQYRQQGYPQQQPYAQAYPQPQQQYQHPQQPYAQPAYPQRQYRQPAQQGHPLYPQTVAR